MAEDTKDQRNAAAAARAEDRAAARAVEQAEKKAGKPEPAPKADPPAAAAPQPAPVAAPPAPKSRTLAELRKARYILGESKKEDGTTAVITKGGVRLAFPGDEIKAGALTQSQLDGQCYQDSHILNTLRPKK